MAMVFAVSSLSSLALSASLSSSLASSSYSAGVRLPGLCVAPRKAVFHITERRNVVVKAAAEGAAEVTAEAAVTVEASVNPVLPLKLQSDLLKKKAKKAELRRKRLVRKRHLRKKGRWPPSKVAKTKNV